jgi:hypothetical protein
MNPEKANRPELSSEPVWVKFSELGLAFLLIRVWAWVLWWVQVLGWRLVQALASAWELVWAWGSGWGICLRNWLHLHRKLKKCLDFDLGAHARR